ncbi:hypothetical protein LSTR_LSTR017563 [Laodelphax striatellus]|uniref:Uncharacterized protein n=1 Tax=Laodelphax striatellus TaxID=195883 RepID=A0A482X5V5_LAOST|nr:hypothetical protein LSTR_LSTR017563 [Laodelphax striatellus]
MCPKGLGGQAAGLSFFNPGAPNGRYISRVVDSLDARRADSWCSGGRLCRRALSLKGWHVFVNKVELNVLAGKEDELRKSGDPKFAHLMDDLHVEITSYAPPAEAHARIAYALAEVRRFLVPDYNDEIRQEQMWEMHVINARGKSTVGNANVESDEDTHSSGRASTSPSIATDQHITTPTPSGVGSTGRKRPLIPGTRPTMSPTKRTVLSILARARAAQAKEIGAISRPLSNGRQLAVGIRTSGLIAAGADLVIN